MNEKSFCALDLNSQTQCYSSIELNANNSFIHLVACSFILLFSHSFIHSFILFFCLFVCLFFFFHVDICPDNWRYYQGYNYRKVSSCDSWSNSQSQCAILGASLPSVHSQEGNVFVQSLHGGENGWLGLSDINTKGTFVSSDGSRLNFNFWATRQPNKFHNEDCIHTLASLKNHE